MTVPFFSASTTSFAFFCSAVFAIGAYVRSEPKSISKRGVKILHHLTGYFFNYSIQVCYG